MNTHSKNIRICPYLFPLMGKYHTAALAFANLRLACQEDSDEWYAFLDQEPNYISDWLREIGACTFSRLACGPTPDEDRLVMLAKLRPDWSKWLDEVSRECPLDHAEYGFVYWDKQFLEFSSVED